MWEVFLNFLFFSLSYIFITKVLARYLIIHRIVHIVNYFSEKAPKNFREALLKEEEENKEKSVERLKDDKALDVNFYCLWIIVIPVMSILIFLKLIHLSIILVLDGFEFKTSIGKTLEESIQKETNEDRKDLG